VASGRLWWVVLELCRFVLAFVLVAPVPVLMVLAVGVSDAAFVVEHHLTFFFPALCLLFLHRSMVDILDLPQ
jgi:hypothetical protein